MKSIGRFVSDFMLVLFFACLALAIGGGAFAIARMLGELIRR